MGRIAELKLLLTEFVSQSQLDAIEKALDKLFAKVGINVEFTKHFVDRVNDMRNSPEISIDDLIELFGQAYQKYGKRLAELDPDTQAVLKDIETDINVPFVLVHNSKTQQLDMVSKTVMRKRNFSTSGPVFKV